MRLSFIVSVLAWFCFFFFLVAAAFVPRESFYLKPEVALCICFVVAFISSVVQIDTK